MTSTNPFDAYQGPPGAPPDETPLDAMDTDMQAGSGALTAPAAAPAAAPQPAATPAPAAPNPFDGFAGPSAPSAGQSFVQNLAHGAADDYTSLAEAADRARLEYAKKYGTIAQSERDRYYDTHGLTGNVDDPRLNAPTQDELDASMQRLNANQQADQDWQKFHSDGVGGKAAAVLGGSIGGLASPTSLLTLPIGGPAGHLVEEAVGALGARPILTGIARAAGSFGAWGASQDAAEQGLDVAAGKQVGFDFQRLELSTGLSVLLGEGIHGAGAAIEHSGVMAKIADLVKSVRGMAPEQAQTGAAAAGEEAAAAHAGAEAPPAAGEAPAAPAAAAPQPPILQSPAATSAQNAAADISSKLKPIEPFTPDAPTQPAQPGGNAGRFLFDPAELKTDASRFQFKDNGDANGVTGRLKSVEKWDDSKAGQMLVWQANDGTLYAADGHQRVGLANRLSEAGDTTPKQIPGILYREADGVTADDMRAIAAAKNIAEGSGSSIDVAKVLRERPDLMDGTLPLTNGESRQGAALARLDDESFRMVVNDVVPANHAAVVGDIIPNDPARQQAAIKAIAKFKPANVEEAAALTQRVAHAELDKATESAQGSMFGDLESPESTAGEEMKIVGRAIKDLRSDKTLFTRVAANADRIERAGSKIARDRSASEAQNSEAFAKVLSADAYSHGPIRDALKALARDVRDGKKSVGEAAGELHAAIRGQAERDGVAGLGSRARSGNDGRAERTGQGANEPSGEPAASEPNAAARADGRAGDDAAGDGPATERGVEGKQQGLIPGVAPVTDRERIALEQGKPVRGGQTEPPAGGLFDENARNQSELFLKAQNMARAVGPRNVNPVVRRPNRAVLPGEASKPAMAHGLTDKELREFKLDGTMRDISNRLGIQYEHARTPSGALGSYRAEGVIRTRYAGDVEVFAHEFGHAIDARLARDPAIKGDWASLIKANEPKLLAMDYNAASTGGTPTVAEGVAEFVRSYITNPAYAAKMAPDFAKGFADLLTRDPELASAVAEATHMSAVESGLNPRQVFETMISNGDGKGLEKFINAAKRNGVLSTVADYASAIYTKVIAGDFPVRRFVMALKDARFQAQGPQKTLSYSDDPYILTRNLPGANQNAVAMVRDGVKPYGDPFAKPTSASLQSAIGQALNGAISRLENENDPLVRSFNAYLVARRARGLWDSFKSGDLRNQPVRASEAETHAAIAEMESGFPQFKQSADQVFDFMRAYFKRQVDAGIVPKKLADEVMGRNGDYVPFFRDMADEKASSGRGAGGSNGIEHAPFMEFRGSTRDIVNPMRSMIESVSIGERVIARNDVYKAIDRMAEEAGPFAGPLWSKLKNSEMKGTTVDLGEALKNAMRAHGASPDDADLAVRQLEEMIGDDLSASVYRSHAITANGQRAVFFWKGGERQARLVGDNTIAREFFDTMTAMSEPEKDLFMKSLGAANAMFQSSIVHAPRFLLGTLVRDNMTRMFMPRQMGLAGRVPMVQDLVGAYALLFDRSFYRAWAGGGGIRGGVYAHAVHSLYEGSALEALTTGRNFASRTADQFKAALASDTALGKVGGVTKALATIPSKFLSDAMRIVESSETVSRIGNAKLTFNYLKKQGLSEADALQGALYESRDTLDYSRRGTGMQTFTRIVPFMNAGIQGADRSARGLVGEPVMAAVRALQRGGYDKLDATDKATLAATWRNWLGIGAAMGVTGSVYYNYVKDSPQYQNATDYMKRNYWIIPAGKDASGNDRALTIHKPYDLPGALITSVEFYQDAMRTHAPGAWGKVASAMAEAIPREFRSLNDALSAQPVVKTAYELATGTKLGYDDHPPSPIIPDQLKQLPVEMQQTAMTSWLAKKLGHEMGVSPLLADHALQSMGGTLGQDVNDIATSMVGQNPLMPMSDVMNKFFFGQVLRTQRGAPGVSADLSALMARDHGSYMRAADGYRAAMEEGDHDQADAVYNAANDEEKAIITLNSSYKFKPKQRALDPLIRSESIASVLYPMMRNLGDGKIDLLDKGHKKGQEKTSLQLTPDQSRALSSQFSQMLGEETRNGLTIAGEPGYTDYNVIDTSPRLEMIKSISPEAYKDLEDRMKKAHVLPAEGVAAVWPEAKARLLKDRDHATLGDLSVRARVGGGVAPAPTPQVQTTPMTAQPASFVQ